MFLGSSSTVRGFRDDSLAGDSALYWRNDLIYIPNSQFIARFNGAIDSMQFNIGLDVGRVIENYGAPDEEGTVAGLNLGVDMTKGPATPSVDWHQGLYSPNRLQADDSFVSVTGTTRF